MRDEDRQRLKEIDAEIWQLREEGSNILSRSILDGPFAPQQFNDAGLHMVQSILLDTYRRLKGSTEPACRAKCPHSIPDPVIKSAFTCTVRLGVEKLSEKSCELIEQAAPHWCPRRHEGGEKEEKGAQEQAEALR